MRERKCGVSGYMNLFKQKKQQRVVRKLESLSQLDRNKVDGWIERLLQIKEGTMFKSTLYVKTWKNRYIISSDAKVR